MITDGLAKKLHDDIKTSGCDFALNDREKKAGYASYKLRLRDFTDAQVNAAAQALQYGNLVELVMALESKTSDLEVIAHLNGFESDAERQEWRKQTIAEFQANFTGETDDGKANVDAE